MKIADDTELLCHICRTVGGLSLHDRRLLTWILAADVNFEEEHRRMRKIGYNSQRDNFVIHGIPGSSQCFATSAWMFISWFRPDLDAHDDAALKKYIAELTAKGTGAEYEWEAQQKQIEKYIGARVELGVDLNTGAGLLSPADLLDRLHYAPVIIGTKHMAGLPGGHIILGVDATPDGKVFCHDPYGDANTGYKDKNGENVIYHTGLFDVNSPDKIRAMWRA